MDRSLKTKLKSLCRVYSRQCTHHHNGDPHPSDLDSMDKDRNSRNWGVDADETAESLLHLAQNNGFQVTFDGMLPQVMRDGSIVPLEY